MSDLASKTVPEPGGAGELLGRLRRETSGLHRKVEDTTVLPGPVSTREDHVQLLRRLHGFRSAVEARLAHLPWAQAWLGPGTALPRHRRAHLLSGDLGSVGAAPEKSAVWLPRLDNIAQALGCLYAVEGSALGGRFLDPAFRAALGDVPTAFFESDGRAHPHPWRSVVSGLGTFKATAGTADEVVLGAGETFLAFGRNLVRSARVRTEAP